MLVRDKWTSLTFQDVFFTEIHQHPPVCGANGTSEARASRGVYMDLGRWKNSLQARLVSVCRNQSLSRSVCHFPTWPAGVTGRPIPALESYVIVNDTHLMLVIPSLSVWFIYLLKSFLLESTLQSASWPSAAPGSGQNRKKYAFIYAGPTHQFVLLHIMVGHSPVVVRKWAGVISLDCWGKVLHCPTVHL